jgi:hypothetical protein
MVSVGGEFYKSIKIETIKPNRLKIKTLSNELYFLQPIPIRATLKWFHFMALWPKFER